VLKGAAAKKAAKLTWTVPANGGSPITGYRVSRAASATGTFTLIASPAATVTSYTDNGRTGGTTSWYRVAAVNAVGTGAVSNTVAVTAGR
jgi:hypothetical protein